MDISQLIREVSNMTGYYQSDVKRILEASLTLIKRDVSNGERIRLPKFGVFEPKMRNERVGRNPHTGEAVPIPARVLPSFTPSLEFKQMLKGGIKDD